MSRPTKVVWRPQIGPQTHLVRCPLAEVFFGGARGGGKTDGVLGKWALKEKRYGAAFNAIMFRRTTVSSEDAIERSKEIYGPLGGTYNESKLRWRMPNGGRVSFCYLDGVQDAAQYQGRNVTDAWVEEAGQYVDPSPIDRLFGVMRSAAGVPIQLILTANPGGAGQHWIAQRYKLIPFPARPIMLKRKLPTGDVHHVAVIPSRIQDNKILMQRDPGYVGRLHMVGSKEIVKAWVEGDWSAVEGAYFDCWSSKMIMRPVALPKEWLRFRSGDWGSYSPFSIGWWAVVQDDWVHPDGRKVPRGAIIRYREIYGKKSGKLTAEQVGDKIVELEHGDPKLSYGVLDPSTFKEDGGPSIAERLNGQLLRAQMISFHGADNTRVTTRDSKDRRGPMAGWDQMRARMVGVLGSNGKPLGVPMIYCFATCSDSIRTIPLLQHDPGKPEDLDTNSEDHAADDWRYGCSSRPWLRDPPEKEEPRDGYRSVSDDYNDVENSFKTL